MKRTTIAFSLLLLVLCSGAALSGEREGSTPEDLAALNPPPPNDVHVAVLPFWGRNETQTTLARACTILNLMRHGFRLAPSGSKSLAGVVRRTDSAIRNDSEYDPLARLDGDDAARIGKALGARWAVHGEFGEMQTVSKDGKVLPSKVSQIDLRLSLIDVRSGRVLYWSRVKDTHSGSFSLLKKASSMERRLITRTVNGIFDDIAMGLPEHYTGAQVTPEEVKQLAASLDR